MGESKEILKECESPFPGGQMKTTEIEEYYGK